jgi:hypothetical protein
MKKTKPAAPAQTPLIDSPMQAYAMRVWEGQSISLSHAERVKRVKAALIDQKFDITDLQLPESDQ